MSLKRRLRRIERRRRLRAGALVAPLLLFLIFTFAVPIAGMLWRSVEDGEVHGYLPRTAAALAAWDGQSLPNEGSYAALRADLEENWANQTTVFPAKRLNYDVNGFWSLLFKTARNLPEPTARGELKDAFVTLDPRWGDRAHWSAIKRASGHLTDFYLLTALDLRRDADNAIVRRPVEEALYLGVFGRTFRISITVTLLCFLMAYPVAYLLATVPAGVRGVLMVLVLLPFWTSILVRTTAWVVLLQNQGIVNGLLLTTGIVTRPQQMIFNRFGVLVAMTHVLLPFMILPLYSVMRGIPQDYMRAAASLGASPAVAFLRVYLPLTMPGISAGCLLVFILAIGYYITPALVGGAGDQMIAYFIAFYTNNTVNWGLASALGVMLLSATLVLYAVYRRLVGAEGMRLG